ncbi:MAG: hypothetical protein ACK5P7_13090, partial [Bdellovibrio sp.]
MNIHLCLLITFFLISNVVMGADPQPDCIAWFNRAKIKTGTKECKLSCTTLTVDMGTFDCPDQC